MNLTVAEGKFLDILCKARNYIYACKFGLFYIGWDLLIECNEQEEEWYKQIQSLLGTIKKWYEEDNARSKLESEEVKKLTECWTKLFDPARIETKKSDPKNKRRETSQSFDVVETEDISDLIRQFNEWNMMAEIVFRRECHEIRRNKK